MLRISLLVVFVFNSLLVFGQDEGFEPIERDTTFKPYVTYNEESGNYILSYMRDAETGKIYKTLYVPPTKVNPILNVSIEKQSKKFNYNYELINSEGSKQDISSLELEIKDQFEDITLPANWYYRNSRVLPYIRVTHKFLSVPEYDEDKPIKFESDLQTDEKLEFIVKSSHPPTVITSYVSGQPQKLSFHFVLPPNLEVRKLRDSLITNVANDRGVELKTIGPRALTFPFDHLNFLDSLRGYIPQAQDLDWLGDASFATELEDHLQQVRSQLVAEDSAQAAATLSGFVGLVEAVNAGNGPAGATLTSEGYALLYFNARYLADRLPEPPAQSAIPELPAALSISSDQASGVFSGDNFTITGINHTPEGNPAGSSEKMKKSNHWATSVAIDSLSAVLEDFYDWSKTEQGGGKAIPLEVNDISLVWGGSYEYNGDWNLNFSHSFHRVGLSVDMERFNTVNGEVIELTDEQVEKLTEFMKKYGGIKYEEEPIHYGFDGGN